MNQISTNPTNEDGSADIQSVIPFVAPKQIEDKSNDVVLDDVQGIVLRALSHARASGRDYVDQCRLAADAVVAVRPDLSPQEVLDAVFRMRERDTALAITQSAA